MGERERLKGNGCAEQLDEWLKGNPVHNTIRDECCPDFSCCQLSLLWPLALRQEFVGAGEEKRNNMLMMSLGSAFERLGARDNVYIVGLDGKTDD